MGHTDHLGSSGAIGPASRNIIHAPHRLDIGGTWDLPPLLYFGKRHKPKTLTIALDIWTKVDIQNNNKQNGHNTIRVSQIDQDTYEWSGRLGAHDYTGRVGLIQSILAFFNIEGAFIDIDIGVPPQIGLGGSGVLSVALVKACAEFTGTYLDAIVRIAHDIENGFFSMTGFQDQMAALAGSGVALWHWDYPPENSIGEEILESQDYHYLEDRIVIAIVGRHNSTEINQQQVEAFLTPANRQGWLDMNNGTTIAANAIQNHDWKLLVDCIHSEHSFRNKIAPQRIANMEPFIIATKGKSGAFATAGAGQAVCWYFSPEVDDISSIKEEWKDLGADLLPSKIAKPGG